MKGVIRYKSLEEALKGIEIPAAITESLDLVEVPYVDFGGKIQAGQLVVHQALAEEVGDIFQVLYQNRFPIHKIVPIAAYNWDDEASMADNNTSAFNYRHIIATDRLSNHSYGRAIDINPFLNPCYARDGKVYPSGSHYDREAAGTVIADGIAVTTFKERGWLWLGEREENMDYQHFEKSLA